MRGIAIAALLILSACTAIDSHVTLPPGVTSLTPTPTYSCSYFDNYATTGYYLYDDLTTCQSSTLANCVVISESFPNGGTANCYRPVDGWASCASITSNWIYTAWGSWCNTGVTDSYGDIVYRQNRSVISCSSTVCTCNQTQVFSRTCTEGVDCSTVDASFNPATSPTPANCP